MKKILLLLVFIIIVTLSLYAGGGGETPDPDPIPSPDPDPVDLVISVGDKLYYITRTTRCELITSLGLIYNTREVTNKWWITDVLIDKSTGNVVDCILESVTLVSDDLYAARNATCLEAITEGSSVTPTYGYLDRKWIIRFDYPQIGVYEIHPRYKRYDRSNSDFITEII